MARRANLPEKKANLAAEKAIPILEKLIDEAPALYSLEEDHPTLTEWKQTGEGILIGAFGDPSSNLQSFHREQCGAYSPYDTREYRREQFCRQLDGMVAILKSSVRQLRLTLPDPQQIFFPAGSQHDAFVEIRKIVKGAMNSIRVVDPYVDETLWSVLKNVQPSVRIDILTNTMKGDFSLEAGKFAAQHGSAVQVRQTPNYHDRFILIDDQRCWHLGASIKDAGSKAFLISELQSPAIISGIKSDLNSKWSSATVVKV